MARVTEKEAIKLLINFGFSENDSCSRFGNGHINDTFLVEENGKKYILQAISDVAFKKPIELMDNIKKVTDFLKEKEKDERKVMTVRPTVDGALFYVDENNRYWRVYTYIENSVCLDRVENNEQFYQCAFAFGNFQRLLSDFPADELFETIPDFHNTPKRYENFLKAVKEDAFNRVKDCEKEIAFIKEREKFYSLLIDANKEGRLPLRVTHNDTKSNNVMLDKDDYSALCVIDLDTVMPGFSVNDFGDSIRFGANTAAEDEKDVSKVSLDISLFTTYAKGFLDGCGGKLEKDEIMLLPEGAKMMTIECGMRFLTDYLSGDTYFRTEYPEHNLVRTRTQLKLVEDMERKWDEMKKTVERLAN